MKKKEDARARFQGALERARPPVGGVPFELITAEVAAVLPILSGISPEVQSRSDYEAFEFRECFTVLSLLGRRLALLDITPTASIQIVLLATESAADPDAPLPDEFLRLAIEAVVEGFVMGREERVTVATETRAAKDLRPLRIDDSALALILSGVHAPSVLSECVDALGRAMLDADVETAIVDLTQLGEPNHEGAAAIFSADEVAKMLGGLCIFSGVDSRWLAAAADARIAPDAIRIAPNLAAAIESAREMASRTSRTETRPWRALLDRIRR